MTSTRMPTSEIVAQAAEARRAEAHDRAIGRRALSARFDRRSGRVIVELTNGCVFGFPASQIPPLSNASASQLGEVSVSPSGAGLHWDALDVHLSVAGLLLDAVDPSAARSELARVAGSARGGAKAAAARANGKKGGRPRKGSVRTPAAKVR